MMRTLDAWIFRCLLDEFVVVDAAATVSEPYRALAASLEGKLGWVRAAIWQDFLRDLPEHERDAVTKAVGRADPLGPLPGALEPAYATLDDVARVLDGQPWLWPRWIASGVLNVVAAEPGVGKTRFALDLARRIWFGLDWPDGQPNGLPPHTRTLWVQGDRNFAEMLQAARDFGLPGHAVALGSSPDGPTTEGLDLDDSDTRAMLASYVVASRAALVVIDTVGMVTARNLTTPVEARAFFAPLIEMAASLSVPVLGLTHLSVHKEALGRRIVEKARVLIKMTHPDPGGQPDRRRVWVDKTAAVKPPPLGITMKSDGNDYDDAPPSAPRAAEAVGKTGRSTARMDACRQWLAQRLASGSVRRSVVRREAVAVGYSISVLYDANEALGVVPVKVDGGWTDWSLPADPTEPLAAVAGERDERD